MLVFFLLLLSLLIPKTTLAASDFILNQNITYTIDKNGNAAVTEEIDLINKYSQIYAKQYRFQLSGSDLSNIVAADAQGNIVEKIETQPEQTIIDLKFNQPVVGKDKTTHFKLKYDVNKLANHKGNVWEIPLPEYSNSNPEDNVGIDIFVPNDFGNLAFSSIPTKNIIEQTNFTHVQLTNFQVKNNKILLLFGNYQLFDFDLKYYLTNDSPNDIKTQIALPPDNSSQKIIFKNLEPLPSKISVDDDGNWLADYLLPPKSNFSVSATGQVKIFPNPQISDNTPPTQNLTQEQLPFWPTSNPTIKDLASRLKTPKAIYEYVVSTLNYDYSGIDTAKRKGALSALETPNASLCTEFTDLFISIARAANIPSREVEGFAYTNNPKIKPVNTNADILHAWPQYYDTKKNTWVSIDPTWAKTTNGIDYFTDLDLNHFAFVFHGLDSRLPLPPGSYKQDRQVKTVTVNFSQKEIRETYLPPSINAVKTGLFQTPQLSIVNPNPNSLYDINLSSGSWQKQIKFLPPFTTIKIDSPQPSFFNSLIPKNSRININIGFHNLTANTSVSYLPHYLNLTIFIASSILLLSIGGIIITTKKRN